MAIFAILVTGFLIEGWRIAATNDPWAAWSPFGNLCWLRALHAGLCDVYRGDEDCPPDGFSWLHLLHSLWLPGLGPLHQDGPRVHVDLEHLPTTPLAPIGANLRKVDFESEGKLGIHSLAGFTWKDLLDFDACTECGRCTAVCPANRVGKLLSPRDIGLDLQRLSHAKNVDLLQPYIGATPALSVEAMWECTTCGACVEACPVSIEQMPKIVDTRRYLVMEDAEFPDTMQQALTSVETRGHPFRGTAFSRVDWAQGLPIATMAEAHEADVLLWVGCGGAFVEPKDHTDRAVAGSALVKLVSRYAMWGVRKNAPATAAQPIGNEFAHSGSWLKRDITTLDRYQVKNIVMLLPALLHHASQRVSHSYSARFEDFRHQRIPVKAGA